MDRIETAMIQTCVVIGCGNVACHLIPALQQAGVTVRQVVSLSAKTCCAKVPIISQWSNLEPNADLYIVSVADQAYQTIITHFPHINRLMVHTSGSLEANIFSQKTNRFGVLYPFQTFSQQDQTIHFDQVPLFLTANNDNDTDLLFELASRLSRHVRIITDEQRKYLHLSGVFINNFTNYLVAMGDKLVSDYGFNKDDWFPLLQKTVEKLTILSPLEAQTGPARRQDNNIIERHKALLAKHPDLQTVYTLLSDQISKFYSNDKI